jgi:hypothetical protein
MSAGVNICTPLSQSLTPPYKLDHPTGSRGSHSYLRTDGCLYPYALIGWGCVYTPTPLGIGVVSDHTPKGGRVWIPLRSYERVMVLSYPIG